MYVVQVLNNLANPGLELFDQDIYQLKSVADSPDAIIVRSSSLHEMAFAENLLVVGRAGAGFNNIPVDRLTQLGVPVMTTPGANANAVKELVLAGLFLAARNICSAWQYTQGLKGTDQQLHIEVEKNKKRFVGQELIGKTLGVIGLGSIGVEVANSARHLDMQVIGFDPAISVHNAWKLRSSVVQAESMQEVIQQCDYLTVHVPLIEATKHLVNAQLLALMKPSAVLLNFSRDGVVDSAAVKDALDNGRLKSYVCDFPGEVFQGYDKVIALPHLGASTEQAQENCATAIVRQVQDYISYGHIRNSVNFPDIKMSRNGGSRFAIINKNIPNVLAQISTLFSDENINIVDMINKSRGDIAATLVGVEGAGNDDILAKLMQIEGVLRARQCQA
jgi:D-3-phosphoglycerate dehydrogenase / 2-oxoglutarate reductase